MNSNERTLISVKERSKRPKSKAEFYIGNYTDTFILLASGLFTAASITLIVFVLLGCYQYQWGSIPPLASVLQRVIAASSLTISSAVMVLVGKRYLFSKLSGDGIEAQRIVIYNNASITSLLGEILHLRFEALSLALLMFWGLGFATGLTANYQIKFVPNMYWSSVTVPSGSLDAQANVTSLFSSTSSFLDTITEGGQMDKSLSFIKELGVIDVIGALTTTRMPMGRILFPSPIFTSLGTGYYHPQLPYSTEFTTPAALNGFEIAVLSVASEPHQHPSCTLHETDIWFVSADTQSITLIVGWPLDGIMSSRFVTTCGPGNDTIPECIHSNGHGYGYGYGGDSSSKSQGQGSRYAAVTQYTATAIMMGGTLFRQANHTRFAVNGTTLTLEMSDTQWAMVMMDVICNASLAGNLSVLDFGIVVNQNEIGDALLATNDEVWASVLSSIIGSYTAANTISNWPSMAIEVPNTNDLLAAPDYGVWVLIANTVMSIIMLIVAWKFGRGNQLHSDFLNSSRILLDTSRNTDVCFFNDSLRSTVNALGNPCLQVIHNKDLDSEALIHSSPRRASESLPASPSSSDYLQDSPSHPASESDHLASHSSSRSNSPSTASYLRTPSALYTPTESMLGPGNEIIVPLLSQTELDHAAQSRLSLPRLPSPTLPIPVYPSPVLDRDPNEES